jgi:hypothetical protein
MSEGEQDFLQLERDDLGRRVANPERQGRAFHRHALPRQDLRRAIEWEVIGVAANQDMGDGCLGGQPVLDHFVTMTRNWAGITSSRSELSGGQPRLRQAHAPRGKATFYRVESACAGLPS